MITAIIRNKDNTLVLDFPCDIYSVYTRLQSIGIAKSPKQIPLTDNEDEDIGVKLYSESDFGQHLLLTLNEKNTVADANMLTLVVGAASEDIKEELEQNILYDQYSSMDEVVAAVRQMTQDAGPVLRQGENKLINNHFINIINICKSCIFTMLKKKRCVFSVNISAPF